MIGNEPIWIEVNCEGTTSGEKYFGRFRVKKYLTHKERAECVRAAEVMCRGITQNLNFRALLSTIAFINTHVLESDAKWWKGEDGMKGLDLIDEDPIWELAALIDGRQKPQEETKSEETTEASK
jgi:hypothetical protein